MADTLNLSLWFPGFDAELMLPRLGDALRHFPFSATRGGIRYASVQPLNWAEPTLHEIGFEEGATIEEALAALGEYAQPDFALRVEAYWDLWIMEASTREWLLQPEKVVFTAQGLDFDEGAFATSGHLMIDFGLDSPFLQEEVELGADDALRVKANVATLIEFVHRVEREGRITGRVLWSETEDNLAQKLIERLQQVH